MIVDRLLELSALEARRAGAGAQTEVELRMVVTGACDGVRWAAQAKRVALVIEHGAELAVKAEAFLLGQAVGNLVQNAVEFTPAGGTVRVTVERRGARACVMVDDSGPGVPDYAVEKVFERFYSLPRPDTGRKSSGLGLSIVREIARLHGGEVTLVNRVEGGARAELILPVG
jgi:two-component system sensor histidine kinase CreC